MAQDLLGTSLKRVGFAAVALVAAATLVAGCSSSGKGKPSSNNSNTTSSGASTTSSTPASGGGSSSSSAVANGDPFLQGFCANYVTEGTKLSQAFANAAQASKDKALKAEVDAFNALAAQAPSSIKPSFEAVSNALHDLQTGNYAALQTDAPKLAAAEQKIAAFFASGCH